jgi:hypothetical protein
MPSNNGRDLPAWSILYNIFAIPYNFMVGFVLGVLAPVGAIAAMVAGVRYLTGKMPFLSLVREPEAAERRLALELVPPDQARGLYEEQKEQITGEIAQLQAEIRTIIEDTRAEAQATAQEEDAEAGE